MQMHRTLLWRSLLGVLVAVILGVVAASPAQAYGPENWQIGFAGTAVAPSTGFGFGFWGWCAFGGGVTSGNTGDCQFSEYIHTSSGRVTCEESADITSWDTSISTIPPTVGFHTFHVTGTATVNPSSATAACESIPGSFPASYIGFDTQIPAAAGHYNLGSVLGPRGELEFQVTQLP